MRIKAHHLKPQQTTQNCVLINSFRHLFLHATSTYECLLCVPRQARGSQSPSKTSA